MRTHKLVVINLDDGDRIQLWVNGIKVYIEAGPRPLIHIARYELGLRVGIFNDEGNMLTKEQSNSPADQVTVVPFADESMKVMADVPETEYASLES